MLARTLRHFLLAASVTIAAAASVAAAAPEAASTATPANQWKGRSCTKPGCTGSDTNPWGQAAGFGVAVLAAGLMARRRDRPAPAASAGR